MKMSSYGSPQRARLHSTGNSALLVFLFDSQFAGGIPSVRQMHPSSQNRQTLQQTSEYLFLFVVALIILAQPAYAFPRHENIHKQIESLEMEWRQAQVSNNVSAMEHLLAEDYLGISANGTVETKIQAIAQHKAGTLRISRLDISDLKVRVYGDTAVVTSKAELEGLNGERDMSGFYRYTRVYNRRLGQWKIVSFEASRIHDPTDRSGKPDRLSKQR